MDNHRGPSSCRPMQGSASSRPFSFRLTDFLHGSLARPVCRSRPVAHISHPLLFSVYRPTAMLWYRHTVPLVSHKQGSSSFLAAPTEPLPPLRLAATARAIIKQALILLRHQACNLPAAVRSSKLALASFRTQFQSINGFVPPREGRAICNPSFLLFLLPSRTSVAWDVYRM